MNEVPRLTVGLPVYNGEKYLAESLEALLGQSYEDFELIISDNASTDGTADICRRYGEQDSRIRYVRQSRNIGCAPNHNFVVKEARGELFKWASDDDLYARSPTPGRR
jgi:glycosyltransferase involved in cell wall biosynthesis